MQLLPNITQADERIRLTTNRQLYRIDLDTYTLIEESRAGDLPLTTFRSKEFSTLLNQIEGEITNVSIYQNDSDHLRLTLNSSEGHKFIFNSAEGHEPYVCEHGTFIFEAAYCFPELSASKPFDRILMTQQLARKIRSHAANITADQFLKNLWTEFEQDAHKQPLFKGRKSSYIEGKHASFVYITQLCGRVIFMASEAP